EHGVGKSGVRRWAGAGDWARGHGDAAVLRRILDVGRTAGRRGGAQPAGALSGAHRAQHQAQDGRTGDRNSAWQGIHTAGSFGSDSARTGRMGTWLARRASAEGRDYGARLLFRRATQRHARGGRDGRTGGGAHSERAHGRQPGLRLRRWVASHGADLRPRRRYLRRVGGDGGGGHHRSPGEPWQQSSWRRRFRRSARQVSPGGVSETTWYRPPAEKRGSESATVVGGGRSQEK